MSEQVEALAKDAYCLFRELVGGVHVLDWEELPPIATNAYTEVVKLCQERLTMNIKQKRNFGMSIEFNSWAQQPWTLIAWDSANGLEIHENFETKEAMQARRSEIETQFATEATGVFA